MSIVTRISGKQILDATIERVKLDSGVTTELDGLRTDLGKVEENLAFPVAHIFENNAQVYANGRPGVIDPSALIRDGWYFQNSTAGHKVNWYFYDGSLTNVSVANFSAYAVVTLDSITSTPFLVVGTVPTGSGDAFPGFYKSSRAFLIPNGAAVVGTKYLIYFGQNPNVHTDLPRIQLTVGPTNGSFNSSERVGFVALHTDSGSSVNNVKILAERLGVNATTFKQEYELRIRHATQVALDAALSQIAALQSVIQVVREAPSGAVNGSNAVFTLAHTPRVGTEHVFLNGLLQEPGVSGDYTISGGTITFSTPPTSGWSLFVSYTR